MKQSIIKKTIAAVLITLALPAQAEDVTTYTDVQYLIITEKGGVANKFYLADSPAVTYKAGELIVSWNGQTLSTALPDVKDYKFITEKIPTGIQSIKNNTPENAAPTFSVTNATIEGLKAGSRVSIYTLNGILITSVSANAEGKVNVRMSQLPQGTYIFKTPTKSFKIINQ